MRVTLAYPHEGHAPDETIDVPVEQGRQLLYDGLARLPDQLDDATISAMVPANDTRTVAELRQYAAERGIDLGGATRRAEMAAVIAAAQAAQITSKPEPASGVESEEAR